MSTSCYGHEARIQFGGLLALEKSQNHRIIWVRRYLKDHLVSTPLLWAGTSPAKSGCSKPHQT